MTTINTIGYGYWPTGNRLPRLLATLQEAEINLLIDIRHSPCPSSLKPQSHYGPRDWHLRHGGQGIDEHLHHVGIEYHWLVELGNPQKNDPDMAILRAHLAQPDRPWPVNRGLALLHQLVREDGKQCCLLCACKNYDACHRKLIVEALSQRYFQGRLPILELSKKATAVRHGVDLNNPTDVATMSSLMPTVSRR
jgi:uncharacterized protein (DUF488 family)